MDSNIAAKMFSLEVSPVLLPVGVSPALTVKIAPDLFNVFIYSFKHVILANNTSPSIKVYTINFPP